MRQCVFCARRSRANLYLGDHGICTECLDELRELLGIGQSGSSERRDVASAPPVSSAPPVPSAPPPAAASSAAPAPSSGLRGAGRQTPPPQGGNGVPGGAVPVPAGMLSGVTRPSAAPPVALPRPTPGGTPPAGVPRPSPGAASSAGMPRPTPGGTPPAGAPRPSPGGGSSAGMPRPAPGGAPPAGAPRPSPGAMPSSNAAARKKKEPDLTSLLGKKS